jgi:hypothetical protein
MATLTENNFVTNSWVGCGGLHMVSLCQTIIDDLLVPGQRRALDLGCGCGAIGITLLALDAITELVMTDIDATSVGFAIENTKRLLPPEKQARVRSYVADVWQVTVDPLPELPFDVIICNAPLSEQLPADDTVNPYRFFNGGWNFQREIFAGLDSQLKVGGIVIIKDLVGATWRHDFSIPCISTIIGNQSTLQRSTEFFNSAGVDIFPRVPAGTEGPSHTHCLRVFQRAV